MAKEMGVSKIEEFLNGPLVAWFSSCLDPSLKAEKLTYEQITDGVLIHHVFLQMDLFCQDGEVVQPAGDATLRARNLKKIVGNIRQFFEEELNHVVIRLPDASRLARDPILHLSEAQLLLKLLLGCAVICPRNEGFVENIKKLEVPTQEAIAEHITQVLHIPGIMLSQEMLQVASETNCAKVFEIVRHVCRVKDYYKNRLRSIARTGVSMDVSMYNQTTIQLSLEEEELEALSSNEVQNLLNLSIRSEGEESQTKDAELLAETRNKLRKQQEELNKKNEDLIEARCEIKSYEEQLNKMRLENEKLVLEARSVKMYRDELDIANEKAERADRLEQEVAKYKEKLDKMDLSEARLKELCKQNELLNENNQNLEEQLNNYRTKANQVTKLQQQIVQLKQQVEELSMENEAGREKNRQLCEENEQLEKLLRTTTKETLDNGFIIDSDDSPNVSMSGYSLSEQLNTSAQCESLKLQLENRRLSSLVDTLKENSFHEESARVAMLAKENKKLAIKYDDVHRQMHNFKNKSELLQSEYNKLVKEALKSENLIRKKELEIERLTELLKAQEEKLQKFSNDISLTDSQKELNMAKTQLAAEKMILLKSKEKLTGDLDHLKTLHDQLNTDYQQLLQDRVQLRAQQREDKLALRKQAESIESLETKIKALEDECASLRSDEIRAEHAELKKEFDRLFKSNETLLTDYKRTRNELSDRLCQEPELRVKSQKIIELQIELSKLQDRVDVLEQMNSTLEKDKCSLVQQNNQLLKQNHHLVTKAFENMREHHKEELKNTDQVNNLKRQKEKLEEKIMDQYRRQEPTPAKKKSSNSIVKKTFVRVTRAGSEFFLNRSRRSFAEESRLADQPSSDFEFTRCHESDDPATRPASRQSTVSAFAGNYPRNRKSVDFLENFEPSNFSFGEARSRKSFDYAGLQARTRKSLDFAELCSLYKNEEEDLDKTLPDPSNVEHIMTSTMHENDDCSTFGRNKSVDLSFEKDQTEELNVSEENNNVGMKELTTVKSRQSIWLDHGCV